MPFVNISWTPVDDAAGYTVKYSIAGAVNTIEVGKSITNLVIKAEVDDLVQIQVAPFNNEGEVGLFSSPVEVRVRRRYNRQVTGVVLDDRR